MDEEKDENEGKRMSVAVKSNSLSHKALLGGGLCNHSTWFCLQRDRDASSFGQVDSVETWRDLKKTVHIIYWNSDKLLSLRKYVSSAAHIETASSRLAL